MGQHQRSRVTECAEAGGGEVDGVVVADDGVDADGGEEADSAGEGKGLPAVAGGLPAPCAGDDEEADVEHAASEAGAVMRDEGDEARINLVEAGGGGAEVFQVLGDEDGCHAEQGDGDARNEHGGAGGEEEAIAEARGAVGWGVGGSS